MKKVSSAEELKNCIQNNRVTISSSNKVPIVTINYQWIIDQIILRTGSICPEILNVLCDLNTEQYEVK